ncbi:MAG TPA: hypothetical protein VK886_12595 [Vicinamibacterales bacterium]|nr:hypothetical protein [Vicinamibacterales bacterium]
MRRLTGIIVMAAAVSAAGCLQKETTHTIYLTPDGKASWMAVEKDVRSDEQAPARRLSEEQQYILAAQAGEHGVARGLAALSPTRLRTRIIRDERPFVVVTEAEFSSIEFAAQRIVTGLGLPADVLVIYDGPVTTLRVRIDVAQAVENEKETPEGDQENPIGELAEDLDRYRFVLTAGRFVHATGFRLADNNTAAVPIEPPRDAIAANGGILELSLSWQ